jgi:hypothetical protein
VSSCEKLFSFFLSQEDMNQKKVHEVFSFLVNLSALSGFVCQTFFSSHEDTKQEKVHEEYFLLCES